VFQAGGKEHLAFHSWSATKNCGPANLGRFMHIVQLSWENGVPRIAALDAP
jgi:hypothetical protein